MYAFINAQSFKLDEIVRLGAGVLAGAVWIRRRARWDETNLSCWANVLSLGIINLTINLVGIALIAWTAQDKKTRKTAAK